jgi:hypothetical protein
VNYKRLTSFWEYMLSNEEDMGGTCSMHVAFWWESLQGKGHMKYIGISVKQ